MHRYEKASHLVIEITILPPMISWLAQTFGTREMAPLVPRTTLRRSIVPFAATVLLPASANAEGAFPRRSAAPCSQPSPNAPIYFHRRVDMDPRATGTSVSVTSDLG